jgi:probable O-glycosylation ligase (exosortase A-associated)
MRDILLTIIVFASIPFILRVPATGALMWVWISVMNPHTQGWGFATQFPFAFIVAVATAFSLLVTAKPKTMPLTPVSVILLLFVLWMNVTALFAILPQASQEQWGKVMKIMLMTFVVLIAIRTREDVQRLIQVLVISLGFYGVKGGLFTIRSGGTERVWGPEGSFIGDNNAVALALIVTIPLMYYLQQNMSNKWLRRAMTATMLLSALAALGSYSRGALLAIVAMLFFLVFKSRNKLAVGALVILLTPALLLFMPQRWSERMDSISDYANDESAQGRLNAWRMAYNLARDRFFGGGFDVSEASIFFRYAPNPNDVHAAHSIYFQVLGEHGFVGLGLYLLLGFLTYRNAAWIVRNTAGIEALHWAFGLARMIQVSLIGFAVGGAFLSLLYYDVPYYLMVALVATRILVERERLQMPATGAAIKKNPRPRGVLHP